MSTAFKKAQDTVQHLDDELPQLQVHVQWTLMPGVPPLLVPTSHMQRWASTYRNMHATAVGLDST